MRGFSLIEVLIVLFIAGAVGMIGQQAYRYGSRRQEPTQEPTFKTTQPFSIESWRSCNRIVITSIARNAYDTRYVDGPRFAEYIAYFDPRDVLSIECRESQRKEQ